MEAEPTAMRPAGQIIPSLLKKLVNRGMSSIHFAITVYQGEVYVPFLFLLFLSWSFYCYFILVLLHYYILVILWVVKFVI